MSRPCCSNYCVKCGKVLFNRRKHAKYCKECMYIVKSEYGKIKNEKNKELLQKM